MKQPDRDRFAHIEHPHARELAARFERVGLARVGSYRVAARVELDADRPITDAGIRAGWGSDSHARATI